MSEILAASTTEEPIVIHAPPTGAADRLAELEPLAPTLDAADGGLSTRGVTMSVDTVTIADVAPATLVTTDVAPADAPRAAVAPTTQRALALDAFRGLLLLAMNFAFTIPAWGPYPQWMYHTQVPPSPTGAYVGAAGLTWRDVLYPGFLFTMSAALPLTMGARLAKGMPYPQILWTALRRGALLVLFALLIGHVNPYWTRDYTKRGNLVAIAGLLVAFAFFVRPRRDWSPRVVRVLRRAAWAGVALALFALPMLYGQTFSVNRRDDIISSIAFCTVAATVIWLCTRRNVAARLAILALVVAARTAASSVDWIGSVWSATPASWLYESWYLELLVIVLPGTIAGDLLARWMSRTEGGSDVASWSRRRLLVLAAAASTCAPVMLVGLYQRRYPAATALLLLGISGALLVLARSPRSERDRILARLCGWAALFLTLGALLEPLEGGIKKDPQTLGYLTLMAGFAIACLTALLIVVDGLRLAKRTMKPLVEVGQNPLFAYVVYMLGIAHVLWLAGVGDAFNATWQQAATRGLFLTAAVGVIVWLTTRHRLLWRA